jgi:hypothetical protein
MVHIILFHRSDSEGQWRPIGVRARLRHLAHSQTLGSFVSFVCKYQGRMHHAKRGESLVSTSSNVTIKLGDNGGIVGSLSYLTKGFRELATCINLAFNSTGVR